MAKEWSKKNKCVQRMCIGLSIGDGAGWSLETSSRGLQLPLSLTSHLFKICKFTVSPGIVSMASVVQLNEETIICVHSSCRTEFLLLTVVFPL